MSADFEAFFTTEFDGTVGPDDADDQGVINPCSVDAKLPAGNLFGSIVRHRSTINGYTKAMTKVGWWKTFKVGTILALASRLNKHEGKVEGNFHTEVEEGYKQLQKRVEALTRLHKTIGAWNESGLPSKLVDILTPQLLEFRAGFPGARLGDLDTYRDLSAQIPSAKDAIGRGHQEDRCGTLCHKRLTQAGGVGMSVG